MQFEFEVGVRERHQVEFSFSQVLGTVRIDVDGETALRRFPLFSMALTKRFEFRVGQDEVHEMVVEKSRPLLLAWMRRQTCQVFVDGELFGDYPGFGSSLTLPVAG